MARKTKTNVEEEVAATPKPKTTRKRATKKKVAAATPSEEIEVVAAEEVNVPVRRLIDNNGNVDLSMIPRGQKHHYMEIAKNLNEQDMTSITNYGAELKNAMNTYSSEFLNKRLDSTSGVKAAQYVSDLIGQLQAIDIDDLSKPSTLKSIARRIPLVKKMILSIDQIKAKYNTIDKNIVGITEKLEGTRLSAIRDNNLLEKQLDNNRSYVDQLAQLIVAGKLKEQELGKKIQDMQVEAYKYKDDEIRQVSDFKENLGKKITDLTMLRFAFQQSLVQIRIIQQTNYQNAQNIETQINTAIPLWRSQLSLAVALYNQKAALKSSRLVAETTNNILKKNSEMMKTQAIEVAKESQKTVIDIETFEKTSQDLIKTFEGVRKAQEEGRAKRQAAEKRIAELEKDMRTRILGISESTERVVAKELIN